MSEDGCELPRWRGPNIGLHTVELGREHRTGYKVIRAIMVNGRPTGVYEDFMTGFVLDEERVWGRPTGIVVTHDGVCWSATTPTAPSSGSRPNGPSTAEASGRADKYMGVIWWSVSVWGSAGPP